MRLSVKRLQQWAISSSLFRPTTLRRAFARLGFVQADPIRSPARAQDLILRHRVRDYRAGDLARFYPKLGLEEDFLYAYGFMPQTTWKLLHPRLESKLSVTEQKVLELVSSHKQIHPRQLEAYLGKERETNAWGGYSKATTRTLEALHYRGLLRVAGRLKGIRLYEKTGEGAEPPMEAGERLRRLALLIAGILAPVSEQSLRAALRHLGYAAPALAGRGTIVGKLIAAGDLASAVVDEVRYVWPETMTMRPRQEESVRFLAPFDPLVWDRRRLEHLWGWRYRFEAYTPISKRTLGYYAMPMLWRDEIIGWVNAGNQGKVLTVEAGYRSKKPDEAGFRRAFEAEVERLRKFLKDRPGRKQAAGEDTEDVVRFLA